MRKGLGKTALALLLVAGPLGLRLGVAHAQDAPLFDPPRPFDGVPIPANSPVLRIVPLKQINAEDDGERQLDVGGGPDSRPANLPPRFTDETTTPTTTGMTTGTAYFAQFVDHDLTLTRTVMDDHLLFPFVFAYGLVDGSFQNRRTPGFDLDPLYRISPFEYPSSPGNLGPWDASNLRFRRLRGDNNALDFFRGPVGQAIIGDGRNDENGVIAHIHRMFMKLHNVHVDRVIERDGIDEAALELGDEQWSAVFQEARNYTTAYYQGIICNQLALQLVGRTLFDALDDAVHPLGPLEAPHATLEFGACGFRLHTLIPVDVQVGASTFVSPIADRLRDRVSWTYLFGPTAHPAGRLDLAVAAPLRDIVRLFIPGNPIEITLDLAQVNLLRGRETTLPSGEEYLAFLLAELGLEPRTTTTIRNKQVLTPANAAAILDPVDDADLLADLDRGDTDLWAYILVEAELNNGVLGPVGQDIIERTFAGLLIGDDWSLLGGLNDAFTPKQMAFFRSATFERLLDEALPPADVNRDNFVDVLDLIVLLRDLGLRDSPADIDGNGVVDGGDLLLLLEAFGTF